MRSKRNRGGSKADVALVAVGAGMARAGTADDFSYATCTPDEAKLYREVRQLMAEAPADQPELSSDDEDYTDRLMSGRTSRRSFGSSPSARHAPPADPIVRRDSVPASGTAQFLGRIASIFDALGTGGSSGAGTPGGVQQDASGRIGPAFSNQCEGHALEEPKEAAPLDDDSAEEEGDADDADDGSADDDDDGDDGGYGDLPGETRADGAEEDPREWSRHTASWAQELDSSDEDEDEGDAAASRPSTMGARRPAPPADHA